MLEIGNSKADAEGKGTHSINALQLNVGAGVELVHAAVHQQHWHLQGSKKLLTYEPKTLKPPCA